MKKFIVILLLAIGSFSVDSSAQCAMCRRVAESSHDAHENKVGRGLNNGIMYLLAIPYVLAGIGLYVYTKKRKA
ncbi:MAG: hypothetical protein IPN88_06640 [Bacteroidetes bacterium]|nr:hypothetical protein [Bacteroidota bacterium]